MLVETIIIRMSYSVMYRVFFGDLPMIIKTIF